MRKARKKLLLLLYLTLLAVLMFAVVTYAWMSIAATLTLSDIELTILTDGALEIAPDAGGKPGDWITIIDVSKFLDGKNTELRPVTFNGEEFSFRSVTYGLDGRIKDYSDDIAYVFKTIDGETVEFAGSAADEKANANGYYVTYDFWLRNMMTDCVLRLSKAVMRSETENLDGSYTREMGKGTFVVGIPEWNDTTYVHESAGNGAQNSMRMLFLIEPEVPVDEAHDKGVDSSVAAGTSDTIYGRNQSENADASEETVSEYVSPGWAATVYEPNAPVVERDEYADEETTAAEEETAPVTIQRHITQAASSWKETDPVLKDEVIYTPGDFTSESALCTITTGYMVHIHVYVWIEGSDPDCTNAISDGRVLMNLQFIGDTESIDNPVKGSDQGIREETTAADDR